MISTAREFKGLYYLIQSGYSNSNYVPKIHFTSTYAQSFLFNVWHYRLGHPSSWCYDTIQKLNCNISSAINKPCDNCHFSKQRHLPFSSSTTITNCVFDLVHVDIWGSYSVPSIQGHKYFLTIVDEHSKFTWLKLMKTKSETRQHLVNFVFHSNTI